MGRVVGVLHMLFQNGVPITLNQKYNLQEEGVGICGLAAWSTQTPWVWHSSWLPSGESSRFFSLH